MVGKYIGPPIDRRQPYGLPSNPSTTRDRNGESIVVDPPPGSGPASKRKNGDPESTCYSRADKLLIKRRAGVVTPIVLRPSQEAGGRVLGKCRT